MCSRNITLYFLSGTAILLVAVLGLAYIGVKAIKPVCRIDQANSDPNLTNRQDQVNDDSVQPHPVQNAACNEPTGQPASSLYEEGLAFVKKGHLYKAFANIRTAFEREPTKIKYRKSLIVLQKLSSAEFALRRIKAQWEHQVKVPRLENLLGEAQHIQECVNDIEIERYSLPATFSVATIRLLHRVSNLVDEMSLELSDRPARRKLDEAWQELDWSGLERLLAQIKEQTANAQSTEFRKLVQTTEEVLIIYKAYLSAKSSCTSMQMATLLTEMVSCLPNHNAQDDEVIHATDRFSEVRHWINREWDSLLPQVKSRFQTLCDDARSLLEKYAKTPITHKEINNWGTATDYEPVIERAKLLSTTHSKLTEAIALAGAVPQAKLNCPLSLEGVESKIHRVCAEAYKRAYILESVYGDLDAAERVYKVVTTLPSFENNAHPANARRQLQKLHMSQPQKGDG